MTQLPLFDLSSDAPALAHLSDLSHLSKKRRRLVVEADLDELNSQKLLSTLIKQVKKLDFQAQITMENTLSNLSWTELPFLCVDTETTGLDRTQNRIIEVAWILFHEKKEIFSESRLCCIDEPLPPEIIQLTGISDDMLVDQSHFSEHADALLNAMKRAEFIVAYNANFDRLFLEAELRRIGRSLPDLPWVDPCTFIRELDRYQKGKKLSDATARWGVQLTGAHRALADAKATGLLLQKIAPLLKAHSLTELIQLQNQWQQEQDRNFKAYLAKKQGTSTM